MKDTGRVAKREIVPMLTVGEAAERLGIKRSALYNLCYKPGGPRSYKVGGALRFKPEEVEEYRLRQKSAPPGGNDT